MVQIRHRNHSFLKFVEKKIKMEMVWKKIEGMKRAIARENAHLQPKPLKIVEECCEFE